MRAEAPSTERLFSRPLAEGDFELISQMHSDPQVMATLGGVKNRIENESWFEKNLSHWRTHDYGLWLFFDKETKAFVGRAGFRHLQIDGESEVEVAYSLAKKFWGRGLATEITQALTARAFEKLDLSSLIAFTLVDNTGSRRVMEKSGFLYERDIVYEGFECVLYRLRRKEDGTTN